MTSYGIADEVQLAAVANILHDCCAEIGSANDKQARDGPLPSTAALFAAHFSNSESDGWEG